MVAQPGACGQIEKYFETGWSIWKTTPIKDASGGFVDDWIKSKDIEGRLRPTSAFSRLDVLNDKKTEVNSLRFYCPIEDLNAGDQVRKGTRKYEVIRPNDVMTFGIFMQVEVKEVF